MELKYRNKNFYKVYGLIEDFKTAINPGTLLMIVALLTMIVANSPLRTWYESIWQLDFFLGVGDFNLLSHHGHALNLLHVINDGIMTVFFFSVGLEIKREILVGELSSFRQAILPIIAAFGGMIVPVIVFFSSGTAQNFSPEEMKGMAIPMATDIAFSIGILSLLGKRVPLSLKIFLLALAIVDDIGGIVVIALFYSSFSLASFLELGGAMVFYAILLTGNRLRINNQLFYFFNGLAIWFLFLQAGIHPTISGVLVAFTVPARPQLNLRSFTSGLKHDIEVLETTIRDKKDNDIVLSNNQVHYLGRIEAAADHAISPLQNMEDNLHDVVNYIIMPLFAFANAGVVFSSGGFHLFEGVSLSIFMGLVIGKMTGIFLFTWLAIKVRLAHMPSGMNWKSLGGLSMLGGVGFTVALFLAGLSYPAGSELLNDAKMGIIAGSVVAGLGGYLWLKYSLKKPVV